MAIDVALTFTDYDWTDGSRPVLTVADDRRSAVFQMGIDQHPTTIEINAESPDDLLDQIEGLADLFRTALIRLRTEHYAPRR